MPQFELITPEALSDMKSMFANVTGLCEALAKDNSALKEPLLWSAEDVAKRTPWKASTILSKKKEIGYVAMGKEIAFEPDKVHAWIAKYRIQPKH